MWNSLTTRETELEQEKIAGAYLGIMIKKDELDSAAIVLAISPGVIKLCLFRALLLV